MMQIERLIKKSLRVFLNVQIHLVFGNTLAKSISLLSGI